MPFQTAHSRLGQWTRAGLWRGLHHALLDELGSQGLIDWSRAIVDGACVRAKKGIPDRSPPSCLPSSNSALAITCIPPPPIGPSPCLPTSGWSSSAGAIRYHQPRPGWWCARPIRRNGQCRGAAGRTVGLSVILRQSRTVGSGGIAQHRSGAAQDGWVHELGAAALVERCRASAVTRGSLTGGD